MLSIHSRRLTDLRFDPSRATFTGCVQIRYALTCDPDAPYDARIQATVPLPRKARYGHIESALIAAALTRLRARLEEVETAPVNIFAADPLALVHAA